MNEQNPRIKSFYQHNQAQRRVSFSKPWTPVNWPLERVRSIHGAKDKANPLPRGPSRSLLKKSSIKLDKSLSSNKGITTRTRKYDVSSSTTVDMHRRSASDPTPAHLKYGMFRRFSKLRKAQPDIIEISPPLSAPRHSELKPVLKAQSSVFRQESMATERLTSRRSHFAPTFAPAPPPPPSPPRPRPRHVHLSVTDPIHLDIKPKKYPSMMLWC